jgi:hypothetical protein
MKEEKNVIDFLKIVLNENENIIEKINKQNEIIKNLLQNYEKEITPKSKEKIYFSKENSGKNIFLSEENKKVEYKLSQGIFILKKNGKDQ